MARRVEGNSDKGVVGKQGEQLLRNLFVDAVTAGHPVADSLVAGFNQQVFCGACGD